ncbi:MAG: histidinol dehydrogenase [Bacteroidia bacterium]
MLELIKYPSKKDWSEIVKRPAFDMFELESTVNSILLKVKANGDKALFEYAELFDKVKLSKLNVETVEIENAINLISADLKSAIEDAYQNIYKFHNAQLENSEKIEIKKGITCWRQSIAIEKVGLYIPGGSAPLFSTVLMLGVPAKIAGCKEIVLCTPSDKDGNVHPAILFAAKLVGVTKVFKVGGAQAIAAMSFGTQTIPKVYKIFGPGNQYVTCAKQLVTKFGIAIDMPAGPSEVAVLADKSCEPSFVAADLLSQAEHGKDSQVMFVTDDAEVCNKINDELVIQLNKLPRKEIAKSALVNSKAILVDNLETGLELLNEYGPEHLIVACENYKELIPNITNAGSVFLGNYSCESAGDYASGTNHTLPTNGYAKAYSGVSLDSFVKKITFQELSKEGLNSISKTIEIMAQEEGLDAHKNAVTIRLK